MYTHDVHTIIMQAIIVLYTHVLHVKSEQAVYHENFFINAIIDSQKSFPACWCVLGEKGSRQLSLAGHCWAWSAEKWEGLGIQLHLEEGHCSEGYLYKHKK